MTKFQFLGFAAFLITDGNGKTILIDPYLDKNDANPIKVKDLPKIDLILISHAAFDHFGESAEIAKQMGCKVICGGDCKALLLEFGVPAEQIIETTWGLMVEAVGIKVRPCVSMHRSATRLKDGRLETALPLGFIIILEDGTRIYNASDTALFSDMKLIGELMKPNVGLMNVSIDNCFEHLPEFLTGEMTPYEAALATKWLGIDCAIACHYPHKDCDDVKEYTKLVKAMNNDEGTAIDVVALNPGQTFIYGK